MRRNGRHKIYDAIVAWLSDERWHALEELRQVTQYPDAWVKQLRKDPKFEVDDARDEIRLRP